MMDRRTFIARLKVDGESLEDLIIAEVPNSGIFKRDLCDNFSKKYEVDRTETVLIVTDVLVRLENKHLVVNEGRGLWHKVL